MTRSEWVTAEFKALRERSGLSLDALAKAMGYARASSIQRYEDPGAYKREHFDRGFVAKLAKALIGKGDPKIVAAEVWPLAGPEFRIIGSFDPDAPIEEAPDDRTEEMPFPAKVGDVANLDIRAGLGLGSPDGVEADERGQLYADHISGFWKFPPAVKAGWRNMPQVYSIPVEGDSMEPTLTSGSYVFVDMTHTLPQPEDIYACDYGDGLTIKRLQLVPRTDKMKVMSDNQRYDDYELRREDVRVYGRVVAWFQWRG
jgi:transcriptional regulator with XRE-family HTH domain